MWRTNQSKEILKNVTVLVPSRNISFTRLEKYTNYTIQILAFTVKGDGNRSEPTVVITDEDSKFCFSYPYIFVLHQTAYITTLHNFRVLVISSFTRV